MTQTAQQTQAEVEREIVNILESSMEDTAIPDAIAAHADKRAGKPVTVKDAKQLEEQLGVPVRISKRFGMTSVAWALGKAPNPWLDERSILLAHSDTNVVWPTAEALRKKEPAYYGAAQERNVHRRALLQEHKTMRDAIGPGAVPAILDQSVIYRAAQAVRQLREARENLQKLIDYGEPLHVANFAIEKLAGIR